MSNLKRFGFFQWFGVIAIFSFIATFLVYQFSSVPLPPVVLVVNGIFTGLCLYVIDWNPGKPPYNILDHRDGMPSSEALREAADKQERAKSGDKAL